MSFLHTERRALAERLPKLDDALSGVTLAELEAEGGPAIRLFREAGGPSLLIGAALGGQGASALEAARVHRAVGSRAPSLAVAMTMHNLTVATLMLYGIYGETPEPLLREIASQNLLVASAGAEGRTGQSIFGATLRADPVAQGYRLNGNKRPCSLSRSADIITATISIPGADQRSFAIVPAASEGIERRPFWGGMVLRGAESDELVFRDVFVPEALVFRASSRDTLEPMERGGFCWFELLVSASYLGMASALVERVLVADRGCAEEQAGLAIEVEGAMSALEGVARRMMSEPLEDDLLPGVLLARYLAQGAIERATSRAFELLGGMAFAQSPDAGYLLTASRALALHPPARPASAAALVGHLRGERFEMS